LFFEMFKKKVDTIFRNVSEAKTQNPFNFIFFPPPPPACGMKAFFEHFFFR